MRRQVAFFGFILVLGIFTTAKIAAESADVSKFAYVDEDFQVALDFPVGWKLYTEAKKAPAYFAPLLSDKANNFIEMVGQFRSQEVYARLIAQKYTDDFSNLQANVDALFDQVKIPITKKYFDPNQYLYYVEYPAMTNGLKIKFCEFITQSSDYLLRIGFWTLEQDFEKNKDAFFKIMEDSKYLGQGDKGKEWFPLWLDINLAKADQSQLTPSTDYPGYVPFDQRNYLGYTIKGIKNKVHLIGSIHLGRDDFYPMSQRIEDAFKSTKNLVFEVDENSAESRATAAEIQSRMILAPGKTLKDELGPEIYAYFEAYSKNYGIDLSIYGGFKPWAVVLVIVQQAYMSQGLAGDKGVEKYFQSHGADKKVLDLETLESQIKLFEDMDVSSLIKGSVGEEASVSSQIAQITESWLRGDEKALEKIFLTVNPANAKYMKIMIDDRNITMAKKIEVYLQSDEDYFVVVGAAHVIGPNGIISLLKKKGFKAERL